ncbi:MAG: EAL domain-containing protein [Wolinella sp.]
MQEAIRQNQIISYCQSIYDINKRRISKYEALARPIGKDGTIISPWQFLEIAKHSKQYPLITQTMTTHSKSSHAS